MNHWKHIGKQIARARKEKGWTMKDLGDRIGEHKQNINNLEKGNVKWSVDKVASVAGALGIVIEIEPEQ